MKYKLVFIGLFAMHGLSFAQSIADYGIYGQRNFVTQLVSNPQIPEDGVAAFDFLQTSGAGSYLDWKLNSKFQIRTRLNYTQKGFESRVQYFNTGEPFDGGNGNIVAISFQDYYNLVSKIKFHHLGIDYQLKYDFIREGRMFEPYVLAGFRTDLLVGSNMPVSIDNINGNDKIRRDEYRRVSQGVIIYVGMQINSFLMFEGGLNFDLLPVYDHGDARIKNHVWSLNLGVSIHQMIIEQRQS